MNFASGYSVYAFESRSIGPTRIHFPRTYATMLVLGRIGCKVCGVTVGTDDVEQTALNPLPRLRTLINQHVRALIIGLLTRVSSYRVRRSVIPTRRWSKVEM